VREPWPGAPRTSRQLDDGRRGTPAEAIAASLLVDA
jgi:hypothetical protein